MTRKEANLKRKFFQYVTLFTIAVLLVCGISACSSGNQTAQTTSTGTTAIGSTVIMSNFAFSPSTLTVAMGTTVTWTNKDSSKHTVTSDTGVFNSGGMSQNATYSYTFNTAGTFPYHCTIHTYMTGTIIAH